MQINVLDTPQELGRAAANYTSRLLREAINRQGKARLVLSTGASQFETIKALLESDVAWDKVEMFHLDEYVGLPETHPASFRKYLKERFTSHIHLKQAFFVDGEGDVDAHIAWLTREIMREPIDVALIGIGENAHIAFNDPPADFDTTASYKVVELDEACKKQQVGEGWFATVNDVPKTAITMTVYRILESKVIVSCVPHKVKAKAVKLTLESDVTNLIPATKLKTHEHFHLFLDKASASEADPELLK